MLELIPTFALYLVFVLSQADCLIAVVSYFTDRYESGVYLRIKLPARMEINLFPKMPHDSFKADIQSVHFLSYFSL